MRNEGELTIRDPAIEIEELRSPQLSDKWTVQGGSLKPRIEMRNEIIYPGARVTAAEPFSGANAS
jgi:hypothetical protein